MSFQGKVALVTGGAQGIGKAYSLALLEKGMKVCIVDIQDTSVATFSGSLPNSYKDNIIFHKCDVTSVDDLNAAFERAITHFGRLDVVVNNAGIYNEFDLKKMIDVNFVAVVHGIQLAFQFMGKDKGGKGGYVVNTASKAGFEPSCLCPVYSGTKFAVVGLTKAYGSTYHFQKTGVKVCAIAPCAVDTPMLAVLECNSLDEKLFGQIKKDLKPVKPELLGKALVQLLEDDKNGEILRIKETGTLYYS